MKVLLIQPEYKNTWASPPLGLGYIAAVLKNSGHKIKLLDFTLKPVSRTEASRLIREADPDVVGISLMVRALPEVKSLIDVIKRIHRIPVVLGGAQTTIEPEFSLRYTNADFAVIGEGERTIVDLIDELGNSKNFDRIDGIGWTDKNGEIRINPKREFITNLDEIPAPEWGLIDPRVYNVKPALTPVKNTPIAPIITTRGCPYECSFCAGPLMWRRTFRTRSPKNIVDEIELLMKHYNVRQIFLSDDNFTLRREHAVSLCNEILKRNIKIPWACPNGIRIDKVDDELLRLMRKAGCYLVGFGIESGNQDLLDNAHKRLDLGRVAQVVRMARSHKFITYGFFLIGLPGETKQSIKKTIEFAKKLPLDRAWFNILVPYPGTEVFSIYAKNKPKEEIDWEGIDASTGMIASGIKYENLTGQDLVYWQRRALLEFYFSSPKRFLSVIKNISFGSVSTLIKTSFFKNLFSKKMK